MKIESFSPTLALSYVNLQYLLLHETTLDPEWFIKFKVFHKNEINFFPLKQFSRSLPRVYKLLTVETLSCSGEIPPRAFLIYYQLSARSPHEVLLVPPNRMKKVINSTHKLFLPLTRTQVVSRKWAASLINSLIWMDVSLCLIWVMGGNFSAYQRWLRGMWVKLPPYRHGTGAHAWLQCFAKQVRGQIKTEFAIVGKIIAQTFTVFGRSLQKSCGSCRVASCNKKRVRVCNVNKGIPSSPRDIKQRNNLPSPNTESQSKRHCLSAR